MSKKRRSILDADASELENAAKRIMTSPKAETQPKKEVSIPIPDNTLSKKQSEEVLPPQKKKTRKTATNNNNKDIKLTGKNKMIYLDQTIHREARIKASIAGKTIKQFITDLILAHKS